jgi:hypothetical protein
MFTDIKIFNNLNYKKLEWKAFKHFKNDEYYLTSKNIDDNHEYLFAKLRQDNNKYSLATAESSNGKWRFINKSKYIFDKDDVDITILSLREHDNKTPWQGGIKYENDVFVARYFNDLLEFKNGKKFKKSTDSIIGYSMSLLDYDSYEPVMKFKKHYRYKSIASVKIDSNFFNRPELLLLVIFGCQIVLMDYHILGNYPG